VVLEAKHVVPWAKGFLTESLDFLESVGSVFGLGAQLDTVRHGARPANPVVFTHARARVWCECVCSLTLSDVLSFCARRCLRAMMWVWRLARIVLPAAGPCAGRA
jgi:hypothetical protein